MHRIILLTGSNQGNCLNNISEAANYISAKIGTISKQSSVYKTAPWGNTNQQYFLNQVLDVLTTKTAEQVLENLLSIEQKMGRVRLQKWAARTIDIDILFYDNTILQQANLQIPHPLLHLRKFTLLPLLEIVPELIHPVLKKDIKQLLIECPDTGVVEKM